jgi:serine/threonine-protein kinase RsbW
MPSIRTNVRLAEAFVFDLTDRFHFSEAILDRMLVSVTEAVNNGIVHGNKSNPEKTVRLTCSCFEDKIIFTVYDEGAGFEKERLPDPLAEENLLKESGRGILIIEHLMDEVQYDRTPAGMAIQMTIRLT